MKPNPSRLILLLIILFTTLPATGCIGDPEQIAYLGSPSTHLDAVDDIEPPHDVPPSSDADSQNSNSPDAQNGGLDQGCRDHSDCENESCIQGLCRLCVPTATPFGAGDGSDSDPYQICSPTHLDNIRLKLDAHFRLEDDIEMKAFQDFQPLGTEGSPFTGSLNGNGYQITNLKIDRPNHHYQGLFGLIDSAELSNLKLIDVNITGNNYVGGLLGRNFAGKIINSYVTGEVHGTNYVGGLAGENSYPREPDRVNEPGIIQSSYATGQATGEVRVGGLVGRNLRSEIHNSYALSEVSGDKYVGGLVGESSENNAKIHTSYAISKISGNKDIGGLVGEVWGAPQPKDSYWSTDACSPGQCTNSIGDPLTESEFGWHGNFPSWDFVAIWTMSDKRPILRWEQD